MQQRIVLASNNAKKAVELTALLAPLDYLVVSQAELGVSEAEEPFPGFVENALTKARHAARHTGLPAVADDSGLCVRALDGAPGVHSARFAGEPRSDARNNALLLERLAGQDDRRAYFYSAVVFVRHGEDPRPLIAEGVWHGEILTAEQGAGGFGYDPLFLVPELGLSAAELAPADKNRLSHRGQAMQALLAQLRTEGA